MNTLSKMSESSKCSLVIFEREKNNMKNYIRLYKSARVYQNYQLSLRFEFGKDITIIHIFNIKEAPYNA